jgi:DNA-binding Lrp family transcriptional regulator
VTKLDAQDLRLLDLLQANNQRTVEDLSREVALSPSAVHRRLKRYRNEGLIAADVSVLSSAATGQRLSVLLHLQLDRHAPAAYQPFRRQLLASPAIQLVLEVSGSFDLVLLATVRTMDEFNTLVDELIAPNALVRRYETSFVKKAPKLSLAVPLSR